MIGIDTSSAGFGCGVRSLASALAILSVSCVGRSEPSTYEKAVGSSFSPPKGKSLIYVYRPSWPFTGLIGRPVFINKQLVAETRSGTFAAVIVSPGTYSVQAGALVLMDSPEYRRTYQDINVKLGTGQCVFIRQTVDSLLGNGTSVMMLQTGGAPVPIIMGGGTMPPYGAKLEKAATARPACASLKQVSAKTL